MPEAERPGRAKGDQSSAAEEAKGAEGEEVIEIQGTPTSSEAAFYLDWANESTKATPEKLLDALQKVATLDAALIGGGLFALKDNPIHPAFVLAILTAFVASLCLALFGALPLVDSTVDLRYWETVRDHKKRVVYRRAKWLKRSVASLVCGFLLVLAALVTKLA